MPLKGQHNRLYDNVVWVLIYFSQMGEGRQALSSSLLVGLHETT